MSKRETIESLTKRFPIKRHVVSASEATEVYRRVLRFADGFFATEQQDTLTTNGKDFLTFGEIRYHIKSALALRQRRAAQERKP